MFDIAIVIPCYNEEFRFPLDEFRAFLGLSEYASAVFCLVNDGSKDNTANLLYDLSTEFPERVVVLDLKQNSGKSEAVRLGLLKMYDEYSCQYFAYLDADFATPPSEIFLLLNKLIASNKYKFAMGARWQRLGSNIQRKNHRHYLGRVFATFASIILKLKVYDTQCGAKVLYRELLPVVCKFPFISKWLFDIEVIARIINEYGIQKTESITIEIPLNVWYEKGGSKLKMIDFFKVPLELYRINDKYFKNIN